MRMNEFLAHLDRIIAPTIFSVRTNRRLFRGMVHLTESSSWQRATQVAREYSRWPLTDPDVERHLGLSYDYMMEFLGGPDSPFLATFVDIQIYRLFDFPGAAATASVLFFTALVIVGVAWRAVGPERIRRVYNAPDPGFRYLDLGAIDAAKNPNLQPGMQPPLALQSATVARRSFAILLTALSQLSRPYTTEKLQAAQRCQSQSA